MKQIKSRKHGMFRAYGLFWRLDEINWTPGKGKRREFRLLGRRGANLPGLRIADFRHQRGIYVLYGNYGPHYVGLTRRQTLGERLKYHLSDKHKGQWDRFSWFSFRAVLEATDADGQQKFAKSLSPVPNDHSKMIGDIEALIIKVVALKKVAKMKFADAQEWRQIKEHEASAYLAKAKSK